ncbi:MAG: nucleoside triphosphate pyrophosphohydrolase [Thermovirgaceae bacterium]|nr:nucleoside triphosphate pyrophosphohydrolase [Thermovirgaceae bacterium]
MEKILHLNEQMGQLIKIMDRLRGPGGCPWDREQTLESLRPCILEEAYELIEAIERDDSSSISEECGDLLLQVVFITWIGMEEGRFDLADVVRELNEKLLRRHPHVFGEEKIGTSEDVKKNWDMIKQKERRNWERDSSLFAGIPPDLPALVKSRQIQERAARVGFDWGEGNIEPILDKIHEEIREFSAAVASDDADHIEDEMGDMFFALVNLARHLKIEAESSLQRANRKFVERFRFIEIHVEKSGRAWSDYSLEELEVLWQSAKKALYAKTV